MKFIYRLLFGLHVFVGIGAVAGGLAAITNPESPLGVSIELLENSPFTNYLIPGILLFTVIGLGNIFSVFMLYTESKYLGYISNVFSWALVIWIIVQCIMLNTIAALHIIFFVIGLIQGILAMLILYEQRLFPIDIVLKFCKEVKKEV